MNARVEPPPWLPEGRWWAILAAVIVTGLASNWAIAAGLLIFLLLQVARPFNFLLAFLVVVAGATFVTGAMGGLTAQLSRLTVAILLMLVSYALSNPGRLLSVARTPLTWPLVGYLALSLVNSVRGVLSGYSLRFLGLELIAVLALGSALLVANAFDPRRDLRVAIVGMILIVFGAVIQGFHIFSSVSLHTVSVYAMAGPGIVGLLLFNLALRSGAGIATLGWISLSMPLFLHQFLTFGRGLWTGCLAGLAFSIAIFAGFGRGSATRWGRAGLVVAILAGLVTAAAFQALIFLGQADVLREAWSRLASIGSVKVGYEARSNLIRLSEYSAAMKQILQSPWTGHGIGFSFPVKQPFSNETADQWWLHQSFLLIWLKQGVIGLALFLWTIGSAITLGVRESRRRTDPWESAWLATIAAGTVFLAVLSLSNFPFAVVNEMFLLALLWGGGMAMIREGFVSIRWSPPSAGMVAASFPGSGGTGPSAGTRRA
jgi:O-antigen ligase